MSCARILQANACALKSSKATAVYVLVCDGPMCWCVQCGNVLNVYTIEVTSNIHRSARATVDAKSVYAFVCTEIVCQSKLSALCAIATIVDAVYM